MRDANRVETIKLTAGVVCLGAAWMLAATAAVGQNERTGVANPDPTVITADSPDTAPAPATGAAKPSAAVATSAAEPVYGPYVPYNPDGAQAKAAPAAFDPDAHIVTEATAGQTERRPMDTAATGFKGDPSDPNWGVVVSVPSHAGEIPDGALMKVMLRDDLSSLTTKPGTMFNAEVSEPLMQNGRVLVPVGSVLQGRVTWVRGGRRIGGPAAIHLEPRTVTLPDGTEYLVHARVIDTNSWENTKVDREGTITRSENTKRNVGVMSLTTGSGAAAGAMMGGPAGALIGAGVGAGVSTVVWLKEDRQADLPKGLGLVFSLTEPMAVAPVSAAIAPAKDGTPGGE